MFTDVTMWGIYLRFFSSRGYSFMFTNSAYEMSIGFSNIRGLTLSTWIFINYIRRHHKWNLIFKGKERANNIFIHKDTSQVDFRCIFVNKNIVSSFFPFKDQIPLMMSSNIISIIEVFFLFSVPSLKIILILKPLARSDGE